MGPVGRDDIHDMQCEGSEMLQHAEWFHLMCFNERYRRRSAQNDKEESLAGASLARINGSKVASYDLEEWKKISCTKKLTPVEPHALTFDEFFHRHLLKNIPCVFSKRISSEWLSCRRWVLRSPCHGEGRDRERDVHDREDEDIKINFHFLLEVYGNTLSAIWEIWQTLTSDSVVKLQIKLKKLTRKH